MRIDVVTIFPAYLEPLRLSLVGKAVESGIVDLQVHDLRRWTHDRHHTVDDTPYGGGAGMVMRPEPWGEALDDLLDDPSDPGSRLIVLSPSGRRFDQALATELAGSQRVIFACGRYEGIDARVAAQARERIRTDEVSIGDYVLNGGEVAALAVIESVVRLIPGVIGNPESLREESHAPGHDRLLEYPLYTKPPRWRGLEVPAVLIGGHHAQIADWRRSQAVELTRSRRPDLLPPDRQPITVDPAVQADAGELLTLQRAAYLSEGRRYGVDILPLVEEVSDVLAALVENQVLVARRAGRMLGSVRAHLDGDAWAIGRLMIAPDQQGQGLGSRLLEAVEQRAPSGVRSCRLFTGAHTEANLDFYRNRGYVLTGRQVDPVGDVELAQLEKPVG